MNNKIGLGYVGLPLAHAFSLKYEARINELNEMKTI